MYITKQSFKEHIKQKNAIRHLYRITIKLEYIKLDRDKSTFKSHRDFDSEIQMTFKHF